MQSYIIVDFVAENWEISKRRVQVICWYARIEGAIKHGDVWVIPVNFIKSEALRPGKKGE